MEEMVGAVRSLLRGETVSVQGRTVSLDAVALDSPPQPPPAVLIGTTGQRAVEVAARVADGVLLPEGASAGAVTWVRDTLGPQGEIVAYAWLRIEDDGDRARDTVRPLVHARRDEGMYPNLMRHGGVPDEGDVDDAAVDRVAVAGTPPECAEAIARLAAAGASTVAVLPIGDGAADQIERFAREVAPLVRERE
jgi:5,10-methylenetetrahydromethanopterin reductase